LQGGRAQLDALRSGFVERAVNDMRPVDERLVQLFAKAEARLGNIGDQLRAGLARRVQKFAPRAVLLDRKSVV